MPETYCVTSYSGYVVLFDPAAVALVRAEEPDYETLEDGASAGRLLFWSASEEHVTVRLAVDETLTVEPDTLREEPARSLLRVPGGTLWLSDPLFLHSASDPKEVSDGAGPIHVPAGEYEAAVFTFDWPVEDHESYLRRATGRLPIFARDALAMFAFLLGAATLVGVPVFLIGRMLDDGPAGAARALPLIGAVFVPLWLVVIAGWRLPALRAVGRADEEFGLLHPDAAIQLIRRAP